MEKREQSKSPEEIEKELNIEKLCQLMIPDYEAVKPERIREMDAMRVPTPSNPSPSSAVLSRGRVISKEEQKQILQDAVELKAKLQAKDLAEISAMIDAALAKQWLGGKCTIDDAAKLIAEKIHPDDDYPWMQDDRKECENEYRKHLKAAVISGRVPFFNPHRRIQFDHERLSEERFPLDGLLAKESLYLGLMEKHQGKGYLPLPPKRVSKAPDPIRPLDSGPPDLSYRFVFMAPDWEKWALLDRTRLWKAACLVAEIEPPQDGSEDLWQEVQLKAFPERFRLLWEIVNSDAHISQSEVQTRSGRMLHTVDIGWFAAWAVGKGLPVPEPMKKRAEQFQRGQQQTVATIEKAKQVTPKEVPPTVAAAPVVMAQTDQHEVIDDGGDWREKARQIADELFDRDTANGCRDGLKGYAARVMDEMQARDIRSSRGIIDNPNTVMREALQGAQWWQTKRK